MKENLSLTSKTPGANRFYIFIYHLTYKRGGCWDEKAKNGNQKEDFKAGIYC